jgi:hypothetical protein
MESEAKHAHGRPELTHWEWNTTIPSRMSTGNSLARFTEQMYEEVGNNKGNLTLVADGYRGNFDQLNAFTQGQLGDTLSTLFALRVLDLQYSILHTRKMQKLLAALLKK